MNAPHWSAHPQPPPQKQGSGGTVVLVILIVVGVLVVAGGMLAVMAIYGVRKYVANAKTAEARSALGMIGKDAAVAYESEALEGSWATSAASPDLAASRPKHGLCRSAEPVPRDISEVSGKKYMSSSADWTSWGCLKFQMSVPQYYQYRYDSTGDGFTATAQGDLNGDGVTSKFELVGKVQGDRLVVAPAINETNPDE